MEQEAKEDNDTRPTEPEVETNVVVGPKQWFNKKKEYDKEADLFGHGRSSC